MTQLSCPLRVYLGSLSLLSYVICAFVVHAAWGEVARAMVWPPLYGGRRRDGYHDQPICFSGRLSRRSKTPKRMAGARPLTRAPEQASSEFTRIRIDTYIGMGFSNLVALFIVNTTAAALNAHRVTDIQTSVPKRCARWRGR